LITTSRLKDPVASGDNVWQESSNDGDIAIDEGVIDHELVEVGALTNHDISTSIVKVSNECILKVAFSQLDVDMAESGRAGGW
jgi:hypothetical protein